VKVTRDASSELRELAQLCGIQSFYLATDETMREADPDVLMALLRALGEPVERTKDVTGALRDRRLAGARRVIEPVLVVRPGRSASITVTLPDRVDARDAWFTLTFEDGRERRDQLLADSSPVATLELDGHRFHRYVIEYTALDTARTPIGYHTLSLEVADPPRATTTARSLVISAPACPDAARGWGVFMPLHALRTNDDWGVGSYADLARLGTWIAREGGALVGGLPLYPTYLDPPIDPSPYRPVSRLAYSELYIDPTTLPELALSSSALELMGSISFLTRVDKARNSKLVDYEEVSRLRRLVLEPVADAFFAAPSPRREAFDTFLDAHPEILAYGEFRAAVDQLGRSAVAALATVPEIPGERARSLNYHLYCQWIASEQLSAAASAIPLYADLPVGVHPEGFDPYWSPRSFVMGAKGGAPPDLFYSEGQDWAFPPLHPETIRDDGYHYLRAVLARACRHASYLRVDHVMGLQRLYVIPEGFDAQHGAYVSYHADEMHAVVSLEAHRAGSVVIGEDLGTVPEEVRERMSEDRMLRSWVFEFESNTETPLPEAPSGVLASMTTHDMPRFSSFLWGSDIDEAEKVGHFSAGEADTRRAERALYRESLFRALEIPVLAPAQLTEVARRGCEVHLAASEATLVLIDLEELWGESEPQNRPGTEFGNWRQRGALTLEEAENDTQIHRSLKHINDLRKLFTT
jgi:4-alpha-glucanotransferase